MFALYFSPNPCQIHSLSPPPSFTSFLFFKKVIYQAHIANIIHNNQSAVAAGTFASC